MTSTAQNDEIEKQKQFHRQKFEEFLKSSKEKGSSKIVDQKRSEMIIDVIKGKVEKVDPNLRFFIKKSKFNITTENGADVLSRQQGEKNLPVAIKENFFDILYTIHSVQRAHVGVIKIDKQIRLRYYGTLNSIQFL